MASMTEASVKRRRPGQYTFNGPAALKARLRKGWTQRDVALRCAQLGLLVPDSNLSKYERGEVSPRVRTLAVIAAALELDVDQLVTYTNDAA